MNREETAAESRQEAGVGRGGKDVQENPDPSSSDRNSDAVIIDEAKLVLAEKRTAMALMRTGIAVFALPLSVLSVLIATSRYYDVVHVLHLIVPLAVLNLALLALGTHLVVRALRQLRRYDRLINQLKREHSRIGKFLK